MVRLEGVPYEGLCGLLRSLEPSEKQRKHKAVTG